MGQKVNPLGFRLGVTQKNYSVWFAQNRDYSKTLQEDVKIHQNIEKFFQKQKKHSYLGIAQIEILFKEK